MTQENKELLLKDLCARIPYGVKVQIKNEIVVLNSICDDDGYHFNFIGDDREGVNIEQIKPYLFPLSSMTEEQYNEFFSYYHNIEMDEIKASGDYLKAAYLGENAKHDWLNKNHFDYRYLIDRNLAIDCTNLNIY